MIVNREDCFYLLCLLSHLWGKVIPFIFSRKAAHSRKGDKVIVELKSVEKIAPVHKKQLLTYLRLADKRFGLLINFGASLIKDGIFELRIDCRFSLCLCGFA